MFIDEIEANYPEAIIHNSGVLLSKYKNARYLIVEKGKDVPKTFSSVYPIVYRNKIFRVYDLRP
jgi:hypothetical protein